jgi:hypothetical protein
MVEQRSPKPSVAGSIPVSPAKTPETVGTKTSSEKFQGFIFMEINRDYRYT